MALPNSSFASLTQSEDAAHLTLGGRTHRFAGRWITGGPWERFGMYDSYVVAHSDGSVRTFAAHSGELVPGSTEDLAAYLRQQWGQWKRPTCPLTLELDPTYLCASRDCGSRCFSAAYRRLQPHAMIPGETLKGILDTFASKGGRIVRFDGGGDPLMHPDVRSGALTAWAHRLHLKSAVLTAGDLLPVSNLEALAANACYVRVSVDAGTEATRGRFHGSGVSLRAIHRAIERLAGILTKQKIGVPVGATFLLDESNYREVLDCARQCRESGIMHFSVRRVLGPPSLRPNFSSADLARVSVLLNEVAQLHTRDFRVFVPWRPLDEPDISPRNGQVSASRCWQSTFKTVIEPAGDKDAFHVQLCGRCRGGGIGQEMQMPPVASTVSAGAWVAQWRKSFRSYPVSRPNLIGRCPSCIDRGFIVMMENLIQAVEGKDRQFNILHLQRLKRAADGSRTSSPEGQSQG